VPGDYNRRLARFNQKFTQFLGEEFVKISALVLLSLVFFVCPFLTAQVTPVSIVAPSIVAEVDGHALTDADLDHKMSGSLLQARYQYYMTERKALDKMVDDELLQLAAEHKHMTVDQLLEKEVYKDIKDPSEDQLQVYYEGMESNEPYESLHDQLIEHIRDLRRAKARAAYVKNLRTTATLQIDLAPPVASVDTKDAVLSGSKDAPVVLIEFADYECPYCQKVQPLLLKLKQEYGDKLTIAYKDFPLPMHKRSQKASEAARCAGEQGKYQEFHDMLYATKQLEIADLKKHAQTLKLDEAQFDKCLDSGAEADIVKRNLEEGKSLGISGTPSFFANDHFFSGAVEYSTLHEMVDQQIRARTSPQSLTQTASTK
jgi:protein-disulfide isomerase